MVDCSVVWLQGCPPVDLMIRTSGETRLSDFLLLQSRCDHHPCWRQPVHTAALSSSLLHVAGCVL